MTRPSLQLAATDPCAPDCVLAAAAGSFPRTQDGSCDTFASNPGVLLAIGVEHHGGFARTPDHREASFGAIFVSVLSDTRAWSSNAAVSPEDRGRKASHTPHIDDALPRDTPRSLLVIKMPVSASI
jgi:hypothetical protein